jgi:hypothetical protein
MHATTRLTLALAALGLVTACSDPTEPSPGQFLPGAQPHRIGSYMGSGLSVPDSTTPPITPSTSGETSDERGGSGYVGSGH